MIKSQNQGGQGEMSFCGQGITNLTPIIMSKELKRISGHQPQIIFFFSIISYKMQMKHNR